MRDQLGRTESYEYDFKGNLTKITDRKGQVTTYWYDKEDQLKRADYSDGNYTKGVYDAVGRLISVYDSISGRIEYAYSDTGCATGCSGRAINKVIRETTPIGGISYTYDALRRRTSMTVAGQPGVNYQYDPNSRLTEINSLINGVAADFSLRHNTLGRRTSLTYPNGVTTNYTHDNAGNLTSTSNPM
jgi:YD repeat-containing protein